VKKVDKTSLPVNPPKEPLHTRQSRQDKERYILFSEFPHYSPDFHFALMRDCFSNDLKSDFESDLLDDEEDYGESVPNLSVEKLSAFLQSRLKNPLSIPSSFIKILGYNSSNEINVLTPQEAKQIENYVVKAYARLIGLRELSPSDLQREYARVYDHSVGIFRHEWLKKAEENDALSFLNEADLSANETLEWIRYDHWTKEEAIAISLGKDPKKVCIVNLHELALPSLFLEDFTKRYELLIRSNQNIDLLKPQEFIAWCRQKSIKLNDEFEKVTPQFVPEGDYQYLKAENERLKSLLKSFESDEASLAPVHLMTLILVMAVDRYGYKLGVANSSAFSDLETAYARYKLVLSESALSKKFAKILKDERMKKTVEIMSTVKFSSRAPKNRKKAQP